jgi:hypothetical protein
MHNTDERTEMELDIRGHLLNERLGALQRGYQGKRRDQSERQSEEQTRDRNSRHQVAKAVRAPIVNADICVQAMGEYQADPVENQDLNAYSSPGKVDE